jgi:uncharacterized protein YciI
VKCVVFYESADDVMENAPIHFPAHKQRIDDFVARGVLVMIGTFSDPATQGSMAVFTTREAAEEFVADDPFVRNGVVKGWRIWDWNESLT